MKIYYCDQYSIVGAGIDCFFFKQKTAYEMRISDWSSDVCSSDLYQTAITEQVPNTVNVRQYIANIPGVRSRGVEADQIGRASCRERVCQYVLISAVAVSLNKKIKTHQSDNQIRFLIPICIL